MHYDIKTWRSAGIAARILILSPRWRRAISFGTRLIYLQGKGHRPGGYVAEKMSSFYRESRAVL
jgi:hypothetical protein